ncbi:MAG: hypothetical protein HYZ26_14090 [Chloroflexi bacterium]|nr:hypothetical protein [Chloroflexota bacterium]
MLDKISPWVGIVSSIMQAIPGLRELAPGPRLRVMGTETRIQRVFQYEISTELREEVDGDESFFVTTTTGPPTVLHWDKKYKKVGERDAQFALVFIENKPLYPTTNSDAMHVTATMDYIGNSVQIYGLKGRFWETGKTKRVVAIEDADTATTIERLPNGTRIALVIAMKYPEDRVVFAYNADSNSSKDWKKSDYPLGNKLTRIQVCLRGGNFRDATFEFGVLVNHNNEMEIRSANE